MVRQLIRCTLGVALVVTWVGCVGPKPISEYNLARAARRAAQDAKADSLSPGDWHKADEHYQRAEKLFQENYNDEAKLEFTKAQRYFERAENSTRLKKFRSGEGFP